jgi:hypothetical protein
MTHDELMIDRGYVYKLEDQNPDSSTRIHTIYSKWEGQNRTEAHYWAHVDWKCYRLYAYGDFLLTWESIPVPLPIPRTVPFYC